MIARTNRNATYAGIFSGVLAVFLTWLGRSGPGIGAVGKALWVLGGFAVLAPLPWLVFGTDAAANTSALEQGSDLRQLLLPSLRRAVTWLLSAGGAGSILALLWHIAG